MGEGEHKQKDLEARAKIAAQAMAVCGVVTAAALAAALPEWVVKAAGAGALAMGLGALLFYIEARRAGVAHAEAEQARAQLVAEAARDAALRTPVCAVADVPLDALGVDPVDPHVLDRAIKVHGDQLAYVRRDIDDRLRGHLARAKDGSGPPLVCVHGPSKAGKSRSMLQALRAELPDALLVAPDRSRTALQELLDQRELQHQSDNEDRPVVLWLDDLEGFVRLQDTGIDDGVLTKLKRDVPGFVVAATAGGRGLLTHSDEERAQLQEPLSRLLDANVREPLLAGLSPAERAALRDVVPEHLAREMRDGLGAVAVGGRKLIEILVNESHPHVDAGRPCPQGAALAWAAITAFRLGATEPLSEELLRKLFDCYATSASDETFQMALRWATAPLYPPVALLRTHEGLITPYDYVVQRAPAREDDAERCAWTFLLSRAHPGMLLGMGLAASNRSRLSDAETAFREAADRGHAVAAHNLGVLLKGRGDLEGAEAAWRRAAARDVAPAAFNLGLLLHDRGDLEGAEAAYRRAEKRDHADAAFNLGVLLKGRGDLEGAEAAWRRADERGHAVAAHNLGVLLHDRGDFEGAEAAYRRSDERGYDDAAFNLGALLEDHDDLEGAEVAYRRAEKRGHASAAFNLGVLLKGRGDLEGAEAAWRRADERDHAVAAFNLGVMLHDRGDFEGAEAAYRRADKRDDDDAAINLGALLNDRGDLEGAEAAYRRAEKRGHAVAAFNLGVLLKERGDLEGAEAAWRRAATSERDDVARAAREALSHREG